MHKVVVDNRVTNNCLVGTWELSCPCVPPLGLFKGPWQILLSHRIHLEPGWRKRISDSY